MRIERKKIYEIPTTEILYVNGNKLLFDIDWFSLDDGTGDNVPGAKRVFLDEDMDDFFDDEEDSEGLPSFNVWE